MSVPLFIRCPKCGSRADLVEATSGISGVYKCTRCDYEKNTIVK